jgi:hypothetical protein
MTESEALDRLAAAGVAEVWDVTAVPDSADAEFAAMLGALADEAAADGDAEMAGYLGDAARWHAEAGL